MKYFNEPKEKVLDELKVNVDQGLSSSEAKTRQEKYGKNEFTPGEEETLWDNIKDGLTEPMIVILLVAALISTGLTYLGNAHFGAENAMYIQQIMLVPIVICLLLLYLGIVCSSLELYRMIEIKMPNYARVLSALFILPIPLALIIRGK